MKKIITILLMVTLILSLSSCSIDLHKYFPNIVKEETTTSKDIHRYISYDNIEDFETALGSGNDVIGSTVTFTVKEVIYAEESGDFNIYKAGNNINFVSERKIPTEAGNTLVVKVTQVDCVNDQYWVVNFTVPT